MVCLMLISWLFDFFLIFGFSGRFLAVSCITGFFCPSQNRGFNILLLFLVCFHLFTGEEEEEEEEEGEREPFFGKE